MIIVKEKKSVPHADARCGNCGSLLQYGNADLTHDYEREKDDNFAYANKYNHSYYCFTCPVCGCKVSASWINRKQD